MEGGHRSRAAGTIVWAAGLPLTMAAWVWSVTDDERFINEPLHAAVETAGGAMAIGVALLLYLRLHATAAARQFLCACAGLVAMGIMDAVHGALHYGITWSWTRHVSTLAGGACFACVWFRVSDSLWQFRRYLICAAAITSAGIAAALYEWAAMLPAPWNEHGYTMPAALANVGGGLGFLAASVFFQRESARAGGRDHLIFARLTLLFGITGLFFALRGPWSGLWWTWHAFRLLAYATAARAGYVIVHGLYRELVRNKETLEMRVEERTRALRERSEELAAGERKFRRIFETANEGIWTLDENARIRMVNPRLCEMFGYSEAELVGHFKHEFVAPDQQEHVRLHFERRKSHIAEQFEVQFVRKDGRALWTVMAAQPIFENGEFRGVLDMITDNTDRKRAELQLAAAQQALQQHAHTLEQRVADRTAELQETVFHLDSFSYSITHDMRAPLRAISGYAQILEQDHKNSLSPDAREMIEHIKSAAQRLDRLIRDVLTYSRVTRSEMPLHAVELGGLAGDVVREYPNLKEFQAAIRVDCRDVWVRGNVAALTQCLSNLIGNAVKFVPLGISPRVRLWCERRGQRVRLWVEDNGIGIDPAQHEKIFGIFQRVHADTAFPGTGIGLAIVKRAVERMGGTAGVESERGKGARFWIELPVAAKTEKDAEIR